MLMTVNMKKDDGEGDEQSSGDGIWDSSDVKYDCHLDGQQD